ncbi:hypothetical protein NHQ30_000881 [Ciborinia camelliae]|nr:hypothetical protein NHQ30_000881 [Ciborinia camelliae]
MPFLDLSPELIHKILLEAVFTRGIPRSLRLKLVCKRFSQDVQFALFESRLLDSFDTHERLIHWHIDRDRRMSNFWHSYLVYRVQYNFECFPPYFSHIRRVAETLCKETCGNLQATIESLCWAALKGGSDCYISMRWLLRNNLDFELDLLCAAVYLNVVPMAKRLAKRLFHEGYTPARRSALFNSPMLLAAWSGNSHLVEYFQERMFESLKVEGGIRIDSWNRDSVLGAAMNGDLDLVKLAVYAPSRLMPDSPEYISDPLGNVDYDYWDGYILAEAQLSTGNIEVYKYLGSFFANPDENSDNALHKYVRLGNLEILRYILDSGADIHGLLGKKLLAEACRRGHEDVVDLLLERGGHPNFDGLDAKRLKWQGDNIITISAEGRNLPIIRKLLDHGANLRQVQTGEIALEWAVLREDTEMVKMLLASGVDLASWGGELLRSAVYRGLDSMVEILQGEFFKLSVLQRARWMMVLNGTIDPAR